MAGMEPLLAARHIGGIVKPGLAPLLAVLTVLTVLTIGTVGTIAHGYRTAVAIVWLLVAVRVDANREGCSTGRTLWRRTLDDSGANPIIAVLAVLTVGTWGTVLAVRAITTIGTVGTGGTILTVRAIGAVCTVGTVRASRSFLTIVTGRTDLARSAIGTVGTVGTILTVGTGGTGGTGGTVRASRTFRTDVALWAILAGSPDDLRSFASFELLGAAASGNENDCQNCARSHDLALLKGLCVAVHCQ
jgi:hypothetical protein